MASHQRLSAETGEQEAIAPEPVEDEEFTETPPRKRRRPRHRGRFWCFLLIFAGFVGIILGRLASLWIHFDVFNQFAAHFAILLIAGAVGLLFRRARALVALVVMIAGVLALGLWPQIASQEVTKLSDLRGGEKPLKLMSFNTLYTNSDVAAIEAEIRRNDPDVVVMVEFGPDKKPLFDRLSDAYRYNASCSDKPECNLAVVSKLPLSQIESENQWRGPAYMKVNLGPEWNDLTLVGVHTIRFPHSRAQFRQIIELVKYLDQFGQNVVVMGDFNATPYSRTLQSFEERSSLFRITLLPSWPAQLHLPQLSIDHVFIGSRFRRLEETRIGHNAGSDHFPVLTKIAVPVK